jgi:hypothetical protein
LLEKSSDFVQETQQFGIMTYIINYSSGRCINPWLWGMIKTSSK